ncbi:MAG: hypothetical protein EAZ89_05900 [Bacteroidetes bacterium]|nr:MAG: hypothetical protein EAZ89_05900 [Bacteroidota bacterium]
MTDSEFQAIIRLLDDEDPGIETHIRNKLVSLGPEAIPRLETVWEQHEGLIQTRIEDIIHQIQTGDAIRSLRSWLQEKEPSLLEGWFLVTQYHYPGLSFETFRNDFSRLVNRTWLELRSGMNLAERLAVVNRMLYLKERFIPNRNDIADPQNYYINGFMETRKGSPLSLGMLYLILCQELQLQVQGIVLPGYFTLIHEGENEFFVDPFNKGAFFFRNDLTRFLEELKTDDPRYYTPSSNKAIILELVRQLLNCHRKRKNEEKVRDLERMLELLASED